MLQPLLADRLQAEFEANIAEYLPLIIGAAIILGLGVLIGSKLEQIVRRFGHRIDLDKKLQKTPLATLVPDTEGIVSETLGALVKYYVILIAVLGAVQWVGLQFASPWIEAALSFVPAVTAGIVILLVGLLVSDYAAETVRDSEAAQQSGFPAVLAGTTKAICYFLVAVIGLDTMGVNVAILYTFGQAFAYAAGLGLAIAVGLAFGWGGKEYVAENVGDWLDSPGDEMTESKAVTGDD